VLLSKKYDDVENRYNQMDGFFQDIGTFCNEADRKYQQWFWNMWKCCSLQSFKAQNTP
jgi:hypothetical protein